MRAVIKRIFQFKRIYLWLGLPAGFLLVLLARLKNGWVEHFYARKIHLLLERTVGALISLAPFSVSEWLIIVGILGLLFYLGRTIFQNVRQKKMWKHIWYAFFVNIVCLLSVAYFLFVVMMGLCYYRAPVTDYLDIQTEKYSSEDLAEVCAWLCEQANLYREKLPENEAGVAQLTEENWWEVSAEARRSFNALSETYPEIGTVSARNKPVLFSKMLSRVLTMGVYIPYTMESNINVDMTAITVPSTMCHELSHVKGFMRENEANFISFLACIGSDRDDFKYSGYLMAFQYAINQLAAVDREAAAEIVAKVHPGIITDDTADNEYWQKYRHTVISESSEAIYESYLESNDQTDGMRSYGKMVDLLIAWYKQNK